MPFPFTLPTTSSFSFSTSFSSDTHPSLPLTASTYRGVLRDSLKRHKRLAPSERPPHLTRVLQSLDNYLPYLLAIDGGLGSRPVAGQDVNVILTSNPRIEWRPTLSEPSVPGRESARSKLQSLEYEIYFVLSTLAGTHSLLCRASLQPLYSSATASPTPDQRVLAITTATKHLLSASSIYDYMSVRSDQLSSTPPCVDIAKSTLRAMTLLALAEATLLAVLKDDPYPAAVAQTRNSHDKEWMIKAPEMPKPRVHLVARLCLTAAEHAANALSLLSTTSKGQGKIDADLLRYVEDLRKTARAKACRFFGIDAELGGQTGTGIAWLRGGMQEVGISSSSDDGKKASGFGRFKKGWEERREDKRIEKGSDWGADAGRLEEGRVLEMLEKKWVKMNDTINTQAVPPSGPLLATIPSGRDLYTPKPFVPPIIEASVLESMRAPPEGTDDAGLDSSSGNEGDDKQAPAGAFPGTEGNYSGSGNYY